MFTERTQVLLSPEQHRRLKRLARQERRSVGAVIREAVDAYTGSSTDDRREALDRLMGLAAPVDDWEVMKAQILAGGSGSASDPGSDRRG
jgi:predicted DNA-binding protein